ncbi:MAG: NapC/NirT family cytochrome c [Magnetococcales bacterium]|nr:NapC/NirT family cytochrome c [Magnetococcales bacterium]
MIKWLLQPSQKAVGLVLAGGFLAGFVFFIVFHFGMSATNNMNLCISCHEMDGVYQEYKKSLHYSNRVGVQATCADCHVPHGKTFPDWVSKFLVKLEVGSKDIYHHAMGTYPDRAAFEKKRWDLAQNVINSMKSRDSKECRGCHSLEAMDLTAQSKSASNRHKKMMEAGGKTCVDCHTGVAHTMPEEPAAAEPAKDAKPNS